jgi:hypothetical protein
MKDKLTLVDYLLVLIFALFLLILSGFLLDTNHIKGSNSKVTILINNASQARVIFPEVKKGEVVYLNSVNNPLKIVDFKEQKDLEGKLISLTITLKGKGYVDEGRYIFNGQKVSIGQKAEIRGNFFTSGAVESVQIGL